MLIFIEQRQTFIHRIDPRVRLIVLLLFAVVAVSADGGATLGWSLAAATGLLACARMFDKPTLRRLLSANAFILCLLILVPLSTPGTALCRLGPLSWSREGAALAIRIAMKANAVLLACSALIVTMEPTELGFAMTRLGVPGKFAHVFLFMVRYIETIHIEYHRLRNAMKLRGFTPTCSRHSLKSLGYLVAMLLVRSMDRSDRVVDAMKCRGFRGRFYVLETYRMRPLDAVFGTVCLCGTALLGVMEWL